MPDSFKLSWDKTGERFYETGVDRGVLYPMTVVEGVSQYGAGVAWNGLTSVTESPEGAEANDMWADNIKYASLRSAETLGGTIEAYTYPDEFAECDGSATLAAGVKIGQQPRKPFGLSYRTMLGNDTKGLENGYKIHLVYGATASPSERAYETINDSPEGMTFSWEFDTVPVNVTGDFKPTASLEIDSTKVTKAKLTAIEEALYGKGETAPRLLLPDDVLAIINAA